jgi:hypothetical protein
MSTRVVAMASYELIERGTFWYSRSRNSRIMNVEVFTGHGASTDMQVRSIKGPSRREHKRLLDNQVGRIVAQNSDNSHLRRRKTRSRAICIARTSKARWNSARRKMRFLRLPPMVRELQNESGETMVRFIKTSEWPRRSSTVEIQPIAADIPELPWILMLGW